MYDSILFPTDGSQEISDVTAQATQLAAMCDAMLHVLHVVDERAYHSVPDDARERVRETLEDDAESFTESAAQTARETGVATVREVRWGDPTTTILSYAVEHEIEAIVMGTHGRTGYERYLLGSVAEQVVRLAPMPVLTVAVGDTDTQPREIMTEVDTTRISQESADPDRDIDTLPETQSEESPFDG